MNGIHLTILVFCAFSICPAQPMTEMQPDTGYFEDSLDSDTPSTGSSTNIFESLDIGNILTGNNNEVMFLPMSENCRSDLGVVIGGIASGQMVPLKYVDAQAKPPHGILQGNILWLGDHHECVSLDALPNPIAGTSFGSRYFTVRIDVKHSKILYFYLGVCLPDSCTQVDAKKLINETIKYLKILPFANSVEAFASTAYYKEKTELKGGVLTVVVISACMLFLVMVGTCVGLMERIQGNTQHNNTNMAKIEESESLPPHEKSDKNVHQQDNERRKGHVAVVLKFFLSFSFLENSRKLFGTETARGPLACLNGIRVLSMWWVVLGHNYSFSLGVLDNAFSAQTIVQRFSFQFVANGTLSVDSFFFLSGLLVAYLALREIRNHNKMNWVYFVCHRFWRLTPLYAYVLLCFTNILRPLIFGPFSVMAEQNKLIDACKTYWWSNLLYFNNMYPYYGSISEGCMPWTWYLANDMQFYLFLSPIVILLLWKVRKVGIAATCFLIVGGIFARGFLDLYYGMHAPHNSVSKHKDDPWAVDQGYIRPYTRWSVYLIGMLTGHWLSATRTKVCISKAAATIGWCVCTATGIAVVWGLYYYNSHPGTEMSLTASVFYYSLSRTAWSVCLAWIVLACVAEKGGPVKDILSWTIWAPLGRLTYAAYLVHPIVQFAYFYNLETPLHFTDLTMVYLYIANLVMTYGVAFVLSMAVEAPMIQLEKAILGVFRKNK